MYSDLIRNTDDFLRYELKPSLSTVYHGAALHTNRWGMRDKEYELQKPAGTFRVAVLGSSLAMGEGVGDDETFESILEDRLNRQASSDRSTRIELMNFGVGFYNPLQDLIVLEGKAVRFQPDAIFVVGHTSDPFELVHHFSERLSAKVEPPYDFLRDTLKSAGVAQDPKTGIAQETRKDVLDKRLQPYAYPLLTSTYRRMVELCRARGIEPVWIYMPIPGDLWEGSELMSDLIGAARTAGFTVVDLSNVYADRDVEQLTVAAWDNHPNARAHRLIADRLYQELRDNRELVLPGLSDRVAESPPGGR